ncbi:hypothetical protein [Streptomyces sp. 5-10]|uniref:hypothetical protein n=1 Tax=Streptomyces sp. 5-10 TaxID=878925 RepID=UPI00168BCA08|nr:hypothetical protein [Streptomyces sp. 5-10]MBD3004632.1 hypothetical protein [Streptomyces sp. 5-10]
MTEHVYECPTEPNKGLIATIISEPSRFTQPNNSIWCWSCRSWEPVPDAWYEREEMLRTEVKEEWEYIRRNDKSVFQSAPLTGRIAEYCWHRGWKAPDPKDRYDMFQFIRNMEERKPVR